MRAKFVSFILILTLSLIGITPVRVQVNSLINRIPRFRITQSTGPAPGYYFLGIKGIYNNTTPNFLAILDNYETPVYFKIMDDVCTQPQVNHNGSLSYT